MEDSVCTVFRVLPAVNIEIDVSELVSADHTL